MIIESSVFEVSSCQNRTSNQMFQCTFDWCYYNKSISLMGKTEKDYFRTQISILPKNSIFLHWFCVSSQYHWETINPLQGGKKIKKKNRKKKGRKYERRKKKQHFSSWLLIMKKTPFYFCSLKNIWK